MSDIRVNKTNLSDPIPDVVKAGGVCYKIKEINSDAPDTVPTDEYEDCDCCIATSVCYQSCDDSSILIYIDPSALDMSNIPLVVEISGTCYELPLCSQEAPDTFSISSTPPDCDDSVCSGSGSCIYELCDPVSVQYQECAGGGGATIYVDPSVLSTLDPPPDIVEINEICYEYVQKSLTAIDTFSISTDSAVDCADELCVVCPANKTASYLAQSGGTLIFGSCGVCGIPLTNLARQSDLQWLGTVGSQFVYLERVSNEWQVRYLCNAGTPVTVIYKLPGGAGIGQACPPNGNYQHTSFPSAGVACAGTVIPSFMVIS